MRSLTLAALCLSASVIAVPALAQSSAQTTGSSAPNQGHTGAMGTYPRQQLMNDLQKAGFTNIRITPEAFIVHAVNSQGEPVLMRIGPDSVEAVTALKDTGPHMSGSGASASSSSPNGQSGTKTE